MWRSRRGALGTERRGAPALRPRPGRRPHVARLEPAPRASRPTCRWTTPPRHRAYAISGDGRYVVFASQATNLAAGDPDGSSRDVFRKDLVTGAVAIVSRGAGRGAGRRIRRRATRTSPTTAPAWSTRRGPPRTSGLATPRRRPTSCCVTSRSGPATPEVARRRPGGTQASISADGRHVAFESGAVRPGARHDGRGNRRGAGRRGRARPLRATVSTVAFESGAGVARHQLPSGRGDAGGGRRLAMPSISADGRRVVYEVPGAPAQVWAQPRGRRPSA